MLRGDGATDKGRMRPNNEDCWAFDARHSLCVVADGMGGYRGGEVAARLAVESVVGFLTATTDSRNDWPFGFNPALSPVGNRLRTAIHLAHMRVLETALSFDYYAGMGTTIVAALVDGNRLCVAHVGDSRLYLLGRDRIRQLTCDDSWMAQVAQDPEADLARLGAHPLRHALTNVVGALRRAEVHVVEELLAGGELLLLTTDGVHGVLDDAYLEQLVLDAADPRDTAASLVAAALARGSRDDCTALVARYLPG